MNKLQVISSDLNKTPLKKIIPKSHKKLFYYQSSLLSRQNGMVHAVFTRHGGVSAPPYQSLNTGHNTKDQAENIKENRAIIKKVLDTEHLFYMNQIHGRRVVTLHKDNPYDGSLIPDADALITNINNLALMVNLADCQAITIVDPAKRVIANAHCGWRGNVINIAGHVVKRMSTDFGCKALDLKAAISPSLGPCCGEFITYRKIFPEAFKQFMVRENYFNLWEMSRSQLIMAGLKKKNIEIAGICTKCNTDLFFSYRAKKKTGRFTTVAMLSDV